MDKMSKYASRKSYDRVSCQIDQTKCEELLKEHVDDIDGRKYRSDDIEKVVAVYSSFLMACAMLTPRLTKAVVSKAARAIYGASQQSCNDFGDAMTKALAHCKHKGETATTGSKTSKVVVRIYNCFPDAKAIGSGGHKDAHIDIDAEPTSSRDPFEDAAQKVDDDCFAAKPVKSASSKASPQEILEMYGLDYVPSKTPMDTVEILSSQEVLASQDMEDKTPKPASSKLTQVAAPLAPQAKSAKSAQVFSFLRGGVGPKYKMEN